MLTVAYTAVMAEFECEHGIIRIDDEDLHLIGNKSFNVRVNPTGSLREVRLGNRNLARTIMGFPKGFEVDHINRDPLDNRRENLRLATKTENLRNRRGWGNTPYGYKGIVYINNDSTKNPTWRARVSAHGKSKVYAGSSSNIHKAALKYNIAAIKHYGEFVNPNQVSCFSGNKVERDGNCPGCWAECVCCCMCQERHEQVQAYRQSTSG